MTGYVFISYARGADGAYVARLAEFLSGAGVPVWFDRDIVAGDRWERLIREKIAPCAAMIVVMTPAAEASEWVAREINYAEQRGRPIVPLLAAGDPFFRLGNLHHDSVLNGSMPSGAVVRRLHHLVGEGDAPSPSASVPARLSTNTHLGAMRYTAVWARGDADEIRVDGLRYVDYRARYDELWPMGWRLRLIVVHVLDGEPRFTAVWRRTDEDEIQVYGWAYDDYKARYDELWPLGWRLALLSLYVLGGEPRYTAVWRRSSADEIQAYAWKYDDFLAKCDELKPDGWRLFLLNVYRIAGETLYTAVWRRTGEDQLQIHSYRYDKYREHVDQIWPLGWRLALLSVHMVGGEPHYTAVWHCTTADEISVYGLRHDEYQTRYEGLWSRGWRLALLSIYRM